jgi:hypothetical protein
LLASLQTGKLARMKTTIDLPDDVIREVKLRAVLQRRPLKDLIAELLRQSLGMVPCPSETRPASSERVEIGVGGLPTFRCRADAPAARQSIPELLALEQSALAREDLERAGLSL